MAKAKKARSPSRSRSRGSRQLPKRSRGVVAEGTVQPTGSEAVKAAVPADGAVVPAPMETQDVEEATQAVTAEVAVEAAAVPVAVEAAVAPKLMETQDVEEEDTAQQQREVAEGTESLVGAAVFEESTARAHGPPAFG